MNNHVKYSNIDKYSIKFTTDSKQYKTLNDEIPYIDENSYYMLHTYTHGDIPVKLWKYLENYTYCFKFHCTIDGELKIFDLNKWLYNSGNEILYRIVSLQEKINMI